MSASLASSNGTRRPLPRRHLTGADAEIREILDALRAGECCRFIGPPNHHKSIIMRAACARADTQLGLVSLYVGLADFSGNSEKAFLRGLRDALCHKAERFYQRALPRAALTSFADLERWLLELPQLFRANVAVFFDDLDHPSGEFIYNLLTALRAAHQESAGLRLLAVVCASSALARTALGSTSPFENISRLVAVDDLSRAETAQHARAALAIRCTPAALGLLYEETRGDRFLVDEVVRELRKVIVTERPTQVTCGLVRQCIDRIVQQRGHHAIAEGLERIESDPAVLRVILNLLLDEHSTAQAPITPGSLLTRRQMPDPLTITGFVTLLGNQYHIKSPLHRRLLEWHFSSERRGSIFIATGEWDRAIEQLGMGVREDIPAARERVMLAALNAMYTVQTRREAFRYLDAGLCRAYPHARFLIYDNDAARDGLIQLNFDNPPPRHSARALNGTSPQAKALAYPQEFFLHPKGDGQITLLVPLRLTGDSQHLGLVAVENLVSESNRRRSQENILELVRYLQHATRALRNRGEFEALARAQVQRSHDLHHLLQLTEDLLRVEGNTRQVLREALNGAQQALEPRAQMGSIFEYNAETGFLEMVAHTGYSESTARAARFRPGEGLAGYVFRTRRPYIVNDAPGERKRFIQLGVPEDQLILSSIAVPLVGRRGALGVLCLDNLKTKNAFTPADQNILELFAGHAALWLETMTTRDQHERQRELAMVASGLLHEIGGKLANIPDLVSQLVSGIETTATPLVHAPVQELHQIGEDVTRFSDWLDDFMRVQQFSLEEVDLQAQYVRKLVELLPTVSQDKLRINFRLRYAPDSRQTLESCAQEIHGPSDDWLGIERIRFQMGDLMMRLFLHADEIRIRKMPAGLSGSAVAQIRPMQNGTPAQWVVVKIGRRDKIEQERARYEKYVQDFLPARRVSLLRSAFTPHLGAIAYTLANLPWDQAGNFGDFYFRETSAHIIAAVRRLFRETCGPWYRGRKLVGYINLTKTYLTAFELEAQPERFANEIASLRPGFERLQPQIEFPALGRSLPNPLRFIDDGEAVTLPVACCITHGDLHAGNILVNKKGECWLIDFYRTHESHVLRDFVKLEVDIKFNLMPALDLQAFAEFETRLLRWNKPRKKIAPPFQRAELDKAFAVIHALRGEAQSLLDIARANQPRQLEIQYEYLLALLMTTLNVLRLRHYKETPRLQPYRELALLSAGLICQRLTELAQQR